MLTFLIYYCIGLHLNIGITMCGRFAYNKEQITPWAKDKLGVQLDCDSNMDVRPTNTVATIIQTDEKLKPLSLKWGIQPAWAKKLLINAQAETVAEKKTFKAAFAQRRCLVPCSGWYEWKDEGGARKQKYYFSSSKGEPFLMAGIWFDNDETQQLVTLTTSPNLACAKIHQRMPALITTDCIKRWFTDENVSDLLLPINDTHIQITKC